MQKFSCLATAAGAITLMSLPATIVFAQNVPTKGTEPALATTPAAATPADARPATTTEQATAPKKKPVPAHYRKSASKEYLHFVPFDKMW